ncbi:MAG: SDR family oxidoreductase, partial [Candidatus Brockarchaeota archaeon]|nr:SDR family oxidoreductase [Candidatus Brockarchaeota archaeon]
ADSIIKRRGKATHVRAGVASRESVEEALEQVHARLGSVDMLVNGAGGNLKEATVGEQRSFFEIPAEAVHAVLNLNFLGTFVCCQVFGEDMAGKKSGSIVNVSSMNAFRPLTNIPAYSAAKAAVTNFTQWLAVHMAQRYSPAIRVNAVAPGFVLTEQNRFLLVDGKGGLTERGRKIIEHTPMGRMGRPEDVVGPVLWLMGKGSEFVTGAVIPVDGGFSAFGGV